MTPAKALRDLRFSIDKSLRYHQRRRGFFDSAHKWTMFGVILCGSATVASAAPTFAGAVGLLLGTADLVFGYSQKARDHEQLYRRFVELGIKARQSAATDDGVQALTIERERIEADEPPVFWLLEADCDNETTIAWGLDHKNGLVPLSWYHIWLMNFWRADAVTLPHRTGGSAA